MLGEKNIGHVIENVEGTALVWAEEGAYQLRIKQGAGYIQRRGKIIVGRG